MFQNTSLFRDYRKWHIHIRINYKRHALSFINVLEMSEKRKEAVVKIKKRGEKKIKNDVIINGFPLQYVLPLINYHGFKDDKK